MHEDRVFMLKGYLRSQFRAVLVTPEPQTVEKVRNAWGYAVKYTSKSLDEPDHEAALRLLVERHPKWLVIPSLTPSIEVDLKNAVHDVPES